MKRVIIPVLLCATAILVVAAAQNVRATGSMRVASSSARGGIASLKVSVVRGKCEILRAAASEVESLDAQAGCVAAKNIAHAAAECESALYDTIPRRETVPVKWTRGCFIDPAESSHVTWDRGKGTGANRLEHLDEDSRWLSRLSSPGRCRDGVAAPASSDKKTGRRDHDRSAARLLSPSRGACLLSPAASAGSSLPLRPDDLEHPLTTGL